MSYFEYMEMALDDLEDMVEEQMEQTVAIIKPDAVRMGGWAIGQILSIAAARDLHPVAMWMGNLSRGGWETFYEEHRERDFYAELVDFMSAGKCVFVLLEGLQAIKHWRTIIGATDPLKAEPCTVRRMFGTGGPANAVHGSADWQAVEREKRLLFSTPN